MVTGQKDSGSSNSGAAAFGPGLKLAGSAGTGSGSNFGSGGSGSGFGGRGSSNRKTMLAHAGGTVSTQRAVPVGLNWLANHQAADGHWSLQDYSNQCKPGDKTCTGPGEIHSDVAATAMGILPFLATGQTHKSQGHYKDNIRKGIEWLVHQQQPDGNLAKGSEQAMYSHGLATIALSEAYGLSGDRTVGMAASAVNYTIKSQNADGGWRDNPKDPGDMSLVGWQVMALKSAHMAGLNVGGSVFKGASKWLDSVAVNGGVEYAVRPGQPSSLEATAVGLLCRQYLGATRDNPMITGGTDYLLQHLPDEALPNICYWYNGTQFMHNMSGYEWDTWNRKMRESARPQPNPQCRRVC